MSDDQTEASKPAPTDGPLALRLNDQLGHLPEGDRFLDVLKFRRLGEGGGSVLYECWAEAVQAYALDEVRRAVAAERERCAHLCEGIAAGHAGAARRSDARVATHAAGQRDGANECAAAIRRA